jgi:2,3-bisphosphoglycerate-independent phosphoglycerate mutase
LNNQAPKPLVLIILDGFGEAPPSAGNAVAQARKPNLEKLWRKYPTTLLGASGNFVGLPEDAQGASEPGHLTLGAGRIVWQPLEEINRAIRENTLPERKPLQKALQLARENGRLHLLGLISDGGVHSHLEHLRALIKLADQNQIAEIFIHAFSDGRDVPERSLKKYLQEIGQFQTAYSKISLATLIGRYFAMDRDNNLERTEKAYQLLTQGAGEKFYDSASAIEKFYTSDTKSDYYFPPVLINENGLIREDDVCLCFNFRSDRSRQLTNLFRERLPKINYFCLGPYSPDESKIPVIFLPAKVKNNLAEILAQNNLKQLRITETEKYAHLTYFFNSQKEAPVKGEDRLLIPSPKVPSYETVPEMSAYAVTERLLTEIAKDFYDVIFVNFANLDLVGHSGNFSAVVQACEIVDQCVGKIVEAVQKKSGVAIITGDHGIAESMLYQADGTVCPAHTTNPVKCVIVSENLLPQLRSNGGLADIAPTILKILNLPQPKEMTGKSLF